MIADLSQKLSKDKIHTRLIDRLAYAHDASVYRVVPKAVVRPSNEQDIITLLDYGNDTHTPITFRTAGTSLSGQSVGEGIIAETVRDWKKWKILDDGKAIHLEPGVIGGHANRYLSSYHRKIGPDPASLNSCMMGGILANNSSGMVCGVKNNAYHTMQSIQFITADGKKYNTSIEPDYERFIIEQNKLALGITECRKQILASNELTNKIRNKYRIKNTMGYSINSFLDYEHPLDIFAHLLIGSEGTLAFISSVILNTIKDPLSKATGLILFEDIVKACASIPFLSEQGASALEVMDYASLTTVKHIKSPPFDINKLRPNQAGLLCEFEDDVEEHLLDIINHSSEEIKKMGGSLVNSFTSNPRLRDSLWNVRKGLYPTVGALRKSGTSVISEDICVKNTDLPYAVQELHHIFRTWNYNDAVVFGHAKDGNLHFVSSIDLNNKDGIKGFEGMMNDLVSMTIGKFNGSLKAEHGTGRNMAPFVETEWGGELYEVMWKIKTLADPNHILNPGVLLNRNKNTHLENLKQMPLVSENVDLCVECGFCESVCPSRNLTLTPRQRIVINREMMLSEFTQSELDELQHDFGYDGNQTCATDGLCSLECPVNIDTGIFIKEQRRTQHSLFSESVANIIAGNFAAVQRLIRGGLKLGNLISSSGLEKITAGLRRFGFKKIPQWNPYLTGAAKIDLFSSGEGEEVIYFPSCVHRTFGGNKKESVINMMMDIAPQLGVKLIIPESIHSLCCGMPFSSKGYHKAHSTMINKTVNELYALSNNGQIPILLDMSPCSNHIRNEKGIEKLDALKFIDIIELLYNKRHSFDQFEKLNCEVLIHHTCSTQKMHHEDKFISVMEKIADKIIIQETNGCCAAAGDKGLLLPELTESAGGNCAKSYPDIPKDSTGVSTSRMCEITMSQATGVPFYSIIELVHKFLKKRHEK
ncbi:MAG: FAD-binding oxidoreductase [Candidatus Marinimicrobia bacterium]|nr:FAD-binding oxidoreductase [Candidatus Neomarinimicrobiota bacterium]